ncbi:MAG: sorbosone dehydrogenase family protein [Sphingomonadaceae bacterium]|nr:sorbosone dehydrogenase family protein [Sphingomonadaceae bacterium]
MRERLLAALMSAALLAGCGEKAKLDVAAGTGPNPELPAPNHTLLPTINMAKPAGWAPGAMPTPAPGLAVAAFASGLQHPRWLLVLPNGDVLVAESDTPQPHDQVSGFFGRLRNFVERQMMKRAGASGGSPDKIVLLRDTNGDGKADVRTTFLSGLRSPFGMALVGDTLYVADTDALLKFPYQTGETQITAKPTKVVDLPAGPINHHWTKNVVATADGKLLYVTIGSNSNVGENGADAETGRADIWEVNPATGEHRIFAAGLRNPNGMAWEPTTKALWTVVNERDEIGSDLVPDYLTSVQFGGFYGWPWQYWGNHPDSRVKFDKPDVLEDATVPDYGLGPHVAALSLSFATGEALGPHYASGAFIGEHGSWNRKPRSGYQVVFVPFAGGNPVKGAKPEQLLGGFVTADGKAQGRPVGVVLDPKGALLVADDVGNTIWRVTAATPVTSAK